MSLTDLLSDMTARFLETEKKQYAQINALQAQIRTVNSNYEIMKEKPHMAVQNIIVYVVSMAGFLLIFYILSQFDSFLTFFRGLDIPNLTYIMTAITIIVPVIAIILNVIRLKKKHKAQIAKANEWWEQTGRQQVVKLNNSINALSAEAYKYLNINPLYENLRRAECDNSRDCYAIYKIAVRYKTETLSEAFDIYIEMLEEESRREREEYRQQQILEAIEENTRLQEELVSQGRRAEFDRSIIELQLHEIKHR